MSDVADIHDRFIATETAIGLLLNQLSQRYDIDVAGVLASARKEAVAISDGDFASRVAYVLDRFAEAADR